MQSTALSTLLITLLPLCLFPLLIFLSLFFIPLALLTTCIATSALTLRAGIVYCELAFALLCQKLGLVEDNGNPWNGSSQSIGAASTYPVYKGGLQDPRASDYRKVELQRGSINRSTSKSIVSSSSSSRNDNPRLQVDEQPSRVSDADVLPSRDYEGIGGWTTVEPDPSVEKQGRESCKNSYLQWLTMNSRLELPNPDPITSTMPRFRGRRHSSGKRKHERSATAGSLGLSAINRSNTESQLRLESFNRGGRHKSMILLGGLDNSISPLTAAKVSEVIDSTSPEGSGRSSMDESGDGLTMG